MFGSYKEHVETLYEPSKKHVRTIYGSCNHNKSNHKGFVVMTLSGQGNNHVRNMPQPYKKHLRTIYGPYKNHIWTI